MGPIYINSSKCDKQHTEFNFAGHAVICLFSVRHLFNVSQEDLKDIYNYDSAESLVTIREKKPVSFEITLET